ncbi:nicotinate-nucleotide--dimethylbenzimidazole phosphoribosyltransferase [Streptacidiphilus sp. PB12-B1b]|uniref:nicotinate-nucleotide--dimethylbenzimidazole phosphoribosyltransferase n=1 Tax=Streptacidiphilus sp. PB12-B1b TaxID=2705012 RepID=UPI0015FACD76|nr:nicotinate-nucleotide--dimethylbenzimidazole phosphoribosyltransferase [Streptacidiphilus sp. PB12-B1b]QMU76375.1 nicotinate-nucleotide--dimethylbenzimidazole phosphoribosyltransferase [Streptacidiphilus sp. PB12-B1b]
MSDTGHVSTGGLPPAGDQATHVPFGADGSQPQGAVRPPYTFLDLPDGMDEEEDELLMPGPQGSWSESATREPVVQAQPEQTVLLSSVPAPAAPADPEPAAAQPQGEPIAPSWPPLNPPTAQQAAPEQPVVAAPRRPLHAGPPIPDPSMMTGQVPVRSLADRGPSSHGDSVLPTASAVAPHPGPEYLDHPAAEAAAPAAQPEAQAPAVAASPEPLPTVPVQLPSPASTLGGQQTPAPAVVQPEQAPSFEQPAPLSAPVPAPVPDAVSAPVPAQAAAPVAEPIQPVEAQPQPTTEPSPEPLPAPEAVPAAEAVAAPQAEPIQPDAQPQAQEPVEAPAQTPEQVQAPEQLQVPEQAQPQAQVEDQTQPQAVPASAEPIVPAPPAPPTAGGGGRIAAFMASPAPQLLPEPAAQAEPTAQPVPVPEAEPVAAEPAADAQPVAAAEPVAEAQEPAPAQAPAAAVTEAPVAEPPAADATAVGSGLLTGAAPAAPAPEPEPAAAPETPADPAAPLAEAAPEAAATAVAAEAEAEPGAEAEPEGEAEVQEAPEAAPLPDAAPAADAAPEAAIPEAAPEADAPDAAASEADEPGAFDGPAAPGYEDGMREAVHRVMRERRDIRNGFRPDPVPHDVLLRVLEAAHTAPSVGYSQPWDFVVIRSAKTRTRMHELAERQRDAYAESLPKGRAKQFKELKIEAILDTPVNIVVTADRTRGGRHTLGRHTQPQMAPYSAALAVENLWLAARAEGLGVGWVSFFDEVELVRELGLPEHLDVVAYLCVGYVNEFPAEPELAQAGWAKKRPLSWVVHEETYGRRALPGEEPRSVLQETLRGIRPLDAKALGEAWDRQKRMTKPAGSLGMLEIISAQLCGLSRKCPPPIPEPACVAVFAGDHGVHAQGVTHWPQEVTAQMVGNFLAGGAVVNAFANQLGAEVCVVDVGVASELPDAIDSGRTTGLLPRKVRPGTADMTTGPAMTREEALQAIEVGIETARDLVAAGNKALVTGDMGIANTTAAAALICVFTGEDPSVVTGRGTGINDETHARKVAVIREALELHQPDPADPVGVLAAVGGLEHAAIAGFLLGAASLRTPVILDGVIAGAAALVAKAIAPEVLAACIAGHRSAEPGHKAALAKLGLRPLIDLDLRLGEGTGALLALPLVQSAARAMHDVATFDSAGVTEKH